MWKRLFMVFLLALLLESSCIFSLTEKEKETLPDLSKEQLIKIILIYDQSLIEIEQTLKQSEIDFLEKERILTERSASLLETENTLIEKEKDLIDSEGHLRIRENLLAESYRLQKQANKQNFLTGFLYGGATGVAGSLIVGVFNDQN